jgi:hypothetical protein
VLDRTDRETLTRASAFVTRDDGTFRMYYSTGAGWTRSRAGKPLPIYHLRYMESPDGKSWGPEGRVCVDFASENEHAIGRPWVVRHEDAYKMLFSFRTKSCDYRLGYAASDDGISWERHDDQVGIDVSEAGWDSEAVAYGSVVEHNGDVYLFHCGNERGKTGFGYAELEQW